jgi:phage baseplate assembly protein W
MSDSRYRAWRYLHPDIDAPVGAAGLQIGARGRVEMVSGDDSVRQALLLLLSTVPGERVMRPDYGCNLYQLVFLPNDGTTAGLAIHFVRQAIERWEPRVEILRLDAGRNPERPERLDIVLEYRVRATQRAAELSFSLNLREEEA